MRLYPHKPRRSVSYYVINTLTLCCTFAMCLIFVLLLDAAIANAAQPNESAGWQVHVIRPQGQPIVIGSPFPDRRVCEEVRVPIMLEFISDITVCRWVERDMRFG